MNRLYRVIVALRTHELSQFKVVGIDVAVQAGLVLGSELAVRTFVTPFTAI